MYEPTVAEALTRALRRRCPRCGGEELFASRFRLLERCGQCDLVFRKEAGAMTGQMYLSAVVTELFAGALVLLLWFFTDLSTPQALAIGLPLVVGFSYLVLPPSMAIWVAVEFLSDRVGERADWRA